MRNLHPINLLFVLLLLLIVGLACKTSSREKRTGGADTIAASSEVKTNSKLDEYTIKGFRFVYFRIPADLSREALIGTAQKLHDAEPDAQLLLIDDDSHLSEYTAYAKAASGQGDGHHAELPKEWADKHIVANVQKYINGKFVLCEGNGYREIAELE